MFLTRFFNRHAGEYVISNKIFQTTGFHCPQNNFFCIPDIQHHNAVAVGGDNIAVAHPGAAEINHAGCFCDLHAIFPGAHKIAEGVDRIICIPGLGGIPAHAVNDGSGNTPVGRKLA